MPGVESRTVAAIRYEQVIVVVKKAEKSIRFLTRRSRIITDFHHGLIGSAKRYARINNSSIS